ncbi:hypothetical protein ACHHYP_05597 [Achlya hypogyna]|uniref:Putative auto-transporter adhesin head GIN domain-containing protein n=1 Tax=Achlya hypogyna TaxID=1202772 RepID=A0A1V9YXB5_ACHHY|nr:hypothetical protein ACHHYP_05597 [Achlya hypogyna]
MATFADSWSTKVYNASSASLSSIKLYYAAYVHATPATSMSVVLRSNSKSFLDAFDINEEGDQLNVRGLQWYANPFGSLFAKYVMDVYVPEGALASLKAAGFGDIVVSTATLVNSRAFSAVISGSSDLFLSGDTVSLAALHLAVPGSGTLQFHVNATSVAEKTELSVSGSGKVALIGSTFTAKAVRSSVSGSGDIYLGAASRINATAVSTSISGSGSVNYYAAGVCGAHNVSVSGSGDIGAGALVCDTARVSISGSGKAYVQATAAVTASVSGSGTVYAVGAFPPSVSGSLSSTNSPVVATYSLKAIPEYEPSTNAQFGLGWSCLILAGIILLITFIVIRCRKAGRCRCCCRRKRQTASNAPILAPDANVYVSAATPVDAQKHV